MENQVLRNINLLCILLILAGCSATTTEYFPEAKGVEGFSEGSFIEGSFRLKEPGYMMGGEVNSYRMIYLKTEVNPEVGLVDSVLNALISDQNGSDAAYYYLGWVAEKKGYYDAAFEYYNISKMLYDYDSSQEMGLIDKAIYAGDEVLISSCGYRYREWGQELIPCIKNMRQEIASSISRVQSRLFN